ncbi:MAG: metal ABC transporter permease [Deltaproteobacteria bacterium]|jgi:zinc transport system permease protein|nr:metal ABC transporter permease [Deltaproteobacteria bacterium]
MSLATFYDVFAFYEPVFMRKAALAMFLLSIAASGTGVLVVSRRMAFFPDAAGHTVFAGLALGLIFGLPPAPAVLGFGVFIGLVIIWLTRHSNLASDTVIGLVFSGGVALGLALVSRFPEAQSSVTRFFLGDVLTLGDLEIWLLMSLAALSIVFYAFLYNRLMLSCVAPPGRGGGGRSDYVFGAFLSLVVVTAVQAVGVLLVSALLIAPAACGRVAARSGRGMFWTAFAVSLFSGQAGLALSYHPSVNTTTGATVVFISIAVCGVAVLARKLKTLAVRA